MKNLVFAKLHPHAIRPRVAYPGDAGLDLAIMYSYNIPSRGWCDMRTGLGFEIPEGYYGRVTGRSSTFRQRGLLVIEGVADAGFRGEWLVCAYNPTASPKEVHRGDRLAQLIVSPFEPVTLQEVEALSDTERGTAGYGSSGR